MTMMCGSTLPRERSDHPQRGLTSGVGDDLSAASATRRRSPGSTRVRSAGSVSQNPVSNQNSCVCRPGL